MNFLECINFSLFAYILDLMFLVTECFPEYQHKVNEVSFLFLDFYYLFYYVLTFTWPLQTENSSMVLSVLVTLTQFR